MGNQRPADRPTHCVGCGRPIYTPAEFADAAEEDARRHMARGYCDLCYNAGAAVSDEDVRRARMGLVMFLAERRARGVQWYGTMPDPGVFRENRLYRRRYGDRDGLWDENGRTDEDGDER